MMYTVFLDLMNSKQVMPYNVLINVNKLSIIKNDNIF